MKKKKENKKRGAIQKGSNHENTHDNLCSCRRLDARAEYKKKKSGRDDEFFLFFFLEGGKPNFKKKKKKKKKKNGGLTFFPPKGKKTEKRERSIEKKAVAWEADKARSIQACTCAPLVDDIYIYR